MTRSDRSPVLDRNAAGFASAGGPGSLPIRMAEAALRRPAASAVVFLSLTMIAVIVGNALGNQPQRHPHPFFQTRSAPDASGSAASSSPRAAAPVAAPVATPAAAPAVAPALPRPRPVGSLGEPAVADLQTALHDQGLYGGQIDGVLGPATVEAIRAFEKRIGAPVTGEPSELLIAAARAMRPTDATVTGSVPTAAVQPALAAAPVPAPAAPVVDAVARPVGADEAAELPVVDDPAVTIPTGVLRRAAREPLAQGGDTRVQRAQRGLIAAGYGPLKADGRIEEKTIAAIRRYETDRGWTPTGRTSERLLASLPDPAIGRR